MAIENPSFILNEDDLNTDEDKKDKLRPATFEEVVTFLGFGKFNIYLILLTSLAMWCNNLETTNMSYIFTNAQCDLNLSLQDKGYLNSVVYAGMVISAVFWGYLGDTFGRRNVLMFGFLCDSFIIFGSSVSQNLITLLIWKFLGGITINGAMAGLTTYLSEFHSSQYRSRIQMYSGFMVGFSLTILPLLAWIIQSQNWHFSIFNGYIDIHPWNIFLFFTGIPALMGSLSFYFLPESPKFLMSIGNNEKALEVFKSMYFINNKKPLEDFPIKVLEDEAKYTGRSSTENISRKQVLKEGLQQIKPLFCSPYITNLLLVCIIQMFFLQSLNMVRLWTPQLFQAMEDYKQHNNGSTTSLCRMLEIMVVIPEHEGDKCTTKTEHFSVYINSMIVSAITMFAYTLTGTIIHLLGKKKMLIIFGLIGGLTCLSLYFANDTFITLALVTIFTAATTVGGTVILTVTVDIFPTTLRILTVSIVMMVARIGILIGTIIFPILLELGCASTFFVVGSLSTGSAMLCFLLPNTENKPLK